MKSKMLTFLILILLAALALTGCGARRQRMQERSAPAQNEQPAAATLDPTTAVAAPTQAPTQSTAKIEQPKAAQPAASNNGDLNQTADDLTQQLDGLTRDLGSTDTLNDIK